MKGKVRRPTGEYITFMAESEELAEMYANSRDLVIMREPLRPSVLSSDNYKDMLYAYSFNADDPQYYFAGRLEPLDTTKGDEL